MQFLEPAVQGDVAANRAIRINLAAARAGPGFYNLDCVALPGVAILADLNEPLTGCPTTAWRKSTAVTCWSMSRGSWS